MSREAEPKSFQEQLHIEEILLEASAFNLRDELVECAKATCTEEVPAAIYNQYLTDLLKSYEDGNG